MTLPADQIPESVLLVVRTLKSRGFNTYLVGGCVRDLLRGTTPKDFDVATAARPEEVQKCFQRTIPTGIAHGTVTVLSRGHSVEVTTFRSEGEYLDARRPSSVEFHRDIELDLSRRDFTVNAIAYDPTDGAIVDPFDGRADIEAKIIRCVRNAVDRFTEDGLRSLRAVRFSAVLNFQLEAETQAAIPKCLGSFSKVAKERIREEFSKLLVSNEPGRGIALLRSTGLLSMFLPEVHAQPSNVLDSVSRSLDVSQANLELRLAIIVHALTSEKITRDVLMRLKYPTKVIETVVALFRERAVDVSRLSTNADIRRWLSKVGGELSETIVDLRVSLTRGQNFPMAALAELENFRARLHAVLATKPPLTAKDLALNGTDIMALLHVSPSRIVGEATRFLVETVLEDPSMNTREELGKRLARWAEERAN